MQHPQQCHDLARPPARTTTRPCSLTPAVAVPPQQPPVVSLSRLMEYCVSTADTVAPPLLHAGAMQDASACALKHTFKTNTAHARQACHCPPPLSAAIIASAHMIIQNAVRPRSACMCWERRHQEHRCVHVTQTFSHHCSHGPQAPCWRRLSSPRAPQRLCPPALEGNQWMCTAVHAAAQALTCPHAHAHAHE